MVKSKTERMKNDDKRKSVEVTPKKEEKEFENMSDEEREEKRKRSQAIASVFFRISHRDKDNKPFTNME